MISAPVPENRDSQRDGFSRSEEHTSELQSRRDLVCRLLLEKKKNSQVVGLFRLTASRDMKNPSRYLPAIVERDGSGRPPSSVFSLPDRDYYLKQDARSREVRDAFLGHAARVLQMAGASQNVFFFNDTATTEIYTLSLHDALPI